MPINKVRLEDVKELFLNAIKGSEYDGRDFLNDDDPALKGKKGYAIYASFMFELRNENGARDGAVVYFSRKNMFDVSGEKAIEPLIDKITDALDQKYSTSTINVKLF